MLEIVQLNLVFIFLLPVIGSCLSSSYADVVRVLLFYLLCSFLLIVLEKLGISIYMACIALAILSLQMKKLKTKKFTLIKYQITEEVRSIFKMHTFISMICHLNSKKGLMLQGIQVRSLISILHLMAYGTHIQIYY